MRASRPSHPAPVLLQLLVAGAAITAVAPSLAAQETSGAPVAVGDSIRVTMEAESELVFGRLTSVGEETLVVRIGARDHRLPLALVRKVERGRPRTRWEGFRSGFLAGAAIGVVSGAMLGVAAGGDCGNSRDLICLERSEMALGLGVMLGATAGTVFGLLGTISPGHHWAEVTLAPEVTPIAGPDGTGLSLGASIRF